MATKFVASSDTRVLIIYEPQNAGASSGEAGSFEGHLLHLRNPKNDSTACYMIVNGLLLELHWFKQRYTSWFIGDSVCEDGSCYFTTPLDPLFMVLPILDSARMKKGDDLGKFRALEEMMCVDGYTGYMSLVPLLDKCLHIICEIREVGDSKYYRLDDRKVLAWLLCKAKRISEDLRSTQKNLLNMSKEDMNSYVVGLLSEYLTAEPWLTKLCNSLSVERGASKIGHWVAPPEVLGVAPSQNTKHSGSSVGKGAAAKKGAPQGVRKITSFFARPR
ncbi:ribonuclease H2 subunit B [Marchantia polymorpha subsp. ruderalis]|uniref:Ribonuclease H2 subunit B n=2 Tax=Marchantia polymorpha TaxID=3197 RepID=A0AAF6AZS0_MARPO|nr:hypothetical protein MARPO_0037s0034 [Marchantia polymorpha]BBN05254.1 hypothetical protein Mp_3g11630 [Marchantia polymorpha subsp. ruderalis]|eukprot:PTQ40850.1 hypothetical protein MARPO_0037s0034 [Marchantia polymorpha]